LGARREAHAQPTEAGRHQNLTAEPGRWLSARIANDFHDTSALDRWHSMPATLVIDREKENLAGAIL
jgi:hypothetical protein